MYLRLIDSLSSRRKDLLYMGHVTRVKKKKKKIICHQGLLVNKDTHHP